jgi:acyl dehydratase
MPTFDLTPDLIEEEIVAIEKLTGTPIRVEQWNYEATRDTIRHYSHGLGDDNPLFCSPDYAKKTPYQDLLAPPTFFLTAFDGAIGTGLPGVQPMYAGVDIQFHERIRRGDEVHAAASFGDVKRKSGGVASALIIQTAECTYRDGNDRLLVSMSADTFRIPRREAQSGLAYEPREEAVYSEDELNNIQNAAVNEFRRGSGQLADRAVGEPVPAVVKGPINRIDMTAYYAGLPGSPGYKACELAWKYRYYANHQPEMLPTNYDTSYFSEKVLPSIGHQDANAAQELGMPNAYNNGPQRVGWFAHCVTNWMGDGAFLERLTVQLRRPEIFGDVITISGSIASIDNGVIPRYRLQLVAMNQLGEQTAHASAVVGDDDYGRRQE